MFRPTAKPKRTFDNNTKKRFCDGQLHFNNSLIRYTITTQISISVLIIALFAKHMFLIQTS